MALLWHDSLDYAAGSSFLTSTYPGIFGMTAGGPHPTPGRRSLTGSFSTLRVPNAVPTGFNSEVATVGMLLRMETATTPIDNRVLLAFRESSNAIKIQVFVRTEPNGFYFDFVNTLSGVLVLRTSLVPYNSWHFHEFQVTFSSSQGACVYRIDGNQLHKSQNVNTDPNPVLGWNHVYISFDSFPAVFRIADLYVLDGSGSERMFKTFLGRTSSKKITPGTIDFKNTDWSPNPDPPYKLIALMGQSNMDGLAQPPYTGGWRSPNPSVPVWNTATNAWEPLNVATNAWGHFYFPAGDRLPWHGCNMQLAERIAQLYENSGIANTSNVRLFQLAAGGTTIFPFGANSWHPSRPDGLYPLSVAYLQAGIAALGGSANVERLDIFWYQGESEAIFLGSEVGFKDLFTGYTLDLLLSYASVLAPIPVHVHIVRIHKYLPETHLGAVDIVRSSQDQIAPVVGLYKTLISVDDYRMTDGIHLNARGLNSLGDQVFEAWREAQDFGSLIRDEQSLLSPDAKWMGASANKQILFDQLFQSRPDLVNSPVLATSLLSALESTAGQTLTPSIGGSLPLSNSPAWTLFRKLKQKALSPEQAAASVKVSLS